MPMWQRKRAYVRGKAGSRDRESALKVNLAYRLCYSPRDLPSASRSRERERARASEREREGGREKLSLQRQSTSKETGWRDVQQELARAYVESGCVCWCLVWLCVRMPLAGACACCAHACVRALACLPACLLAVAGDATVFAE